MKRVMSTAVVAGLVLAASQILLTTQVAGGEANWPQWRGPNRTDVSGEKGLLKSWPQDGPRRVWTFDDCGAGYSGPAVVGDKLYLMGAREGKEQLFALDVKSGEELWSADVDDVFEHGRGDGPRSTPTVVGDRAYGLSAAGMLVCVQTTDGKVVWKSSLKDVGGSPPHWGYCESVLVDQKRVICTPGGSQGALAAFDVDSGAVVWQSKDFTDGAQYASIVPVEHNGARQYVQLTMQSVVGVNPIDGGLLWKEGFPGRTAVVATPIYHDGQVFVTAGYGVGCKLVNVDAENKASEVYSNKNMKNHHGGVIFVDDHLYGYSDGHGWICQDFKTGEIVWAEKEKLGKGAIGYADGHFYCFSESEGTVVLIEASPRGWKESGRFTLAPKSKIRKPRWLIWTHPVITGGRLYLRNQELLFSFNVEQLESGD